VKQAHRVRRYNQAVTWVRPVGALLLLVLISLPISGDLCALLCTRAHDAAVHDSGKAGNGHHETGPLCDEHAPATTSTLSAVPHHDCASHDALLRDSPVASEKVVHPVTTAAVLWMAEAAAPRIHDSLLSSADRGVTLDISPPTTPLVLRV
jgi:hypothetical protein